MHISGIYTDDSLQGIWNFGIVKQESIYLFLLLKLMRLI